MKKFDFIIVGSGVGGVTLAKELIKTKKKILIIELGKHHKKIGGVINMTKYFRQHKLEKKVYVQRAIMAGGTAVLSCANGGRCLEDELKAMNIDLSNEYKTLEDEIGITPTPEEFLSEGSKALIKGAETIGTSFIPMPKLIDFDKCNRCAMCAIGCVHGAKWSPLFWLEDMMKKGLDIIFKTEVIEVNQENNNVKGVKINTGSEVKDLEAETVILAAGGLASPVILQNSGISEAGKKLAIDAAVNVYGITEGINTIREPQMALLNNEFHDSHGYILSPYSNTIKMGRVVTLGTKSLKYSIKNMLCLMVKIKDDDIGTIHPDGSIIKKLTQADKKKLDDGIDMAKKVLVAAGAKEKPFLVSRANAGHPSCGASIGTVVDKDLKTKIDGLYVCDSSVLPETPGKPPILTIAALAKRLGNYFISNQ